ncbi:MAG: hypothetical protein JWM27_4504 [Gemmatimonadetes bacterium]|nr:hypothetical protein [Gemmatimonadota bacterium]
MRVTPAGVATGVRAALLAPRWLSGARLTELMEAPPSTSASAAPPRGSTGSAFLLIRLLARLPRSPWRDTCLYRSVAECLALRRHGVPAVLRIGVRNEDGAIRAHAWVVRAPADGSPAPPTPNDLLHSLLARG